MSRHRHRHGYAALVVSGGYVEAGDSGRFRAAAGDVLFHGAFDAHSDRFSPKGAEILNLPIDFEPPFPAGSCADPDAIVRLAESDALSATAALMRDCVERRTAGEDWPDILARDLRQCGLRIDRWASDHGLTRSSVSRGFRLAYGVTPQRYRLELRAAEAARAIVGGSGIAEAAYAAGFADQPHLSRTLRALYRLTAGQLRSAGNCVQDRATTGR
jgi:AraC-like DNA-binding protein